MLVSLLDLRCVHGGEVPAAITADFVCCLAPGELLTTQ